MKHLHLALAFALALSLGALGGAGCSSSDPTPPADETEEQAADSDASAKDADEAADPAEDKKDEAAPEKDDATETAPAESDEGEPAPAPTENEATDTADDTTKEGETMHVGAEGVGFVDIPSTWVEFQDAAGGDDLQWCDGTPYTIVTLNVIDVSASLTPEERESFTVETAANNIIGHLIDEGMDESSITGAHVTLAGRDAVQVYGSYSSGSILVVWLLEDDAGNYRYVSAEGTPDTIMDAFNIVDSTYQL